MRLWHAKPITYIIILTKGKLDVLFNKVLLHSEMTLNNKKKMN